MDAALLIRTYGYPAIVVGTIFEGESIMLAAGAATSAGLLNPWLVLPAGMFGIFCSDTFCFLVGRWGGARLALRFPRIFARIDAGLRLIARHHEKLIIFYQFFPGMCTITPLAFGVGKISAARFMALDLVGNIIWTTVFTVMGYGAGAIWQSLARSAPKWTLVLGVILTVSVGIRWIILRVSVSKMKPQTDSATPIKKSSDKD